MKKTILFILLLTSILLNGQDTIPEFAPTKYYHTLTPVSGVPIALTEKVKGSLKFGEELSDLQAISSVFLEVGTLGYATNTDVAYRWDGVDWQKTGTGISDATSDLKYYTRKNTSWIESDLNSISKFRVPETTLTFWFADLFNAVDSVNGDNANAAILSDSYGPPYARPLKYYGGDKLGYGGGYRSAAASLANYGGVTGVKLNDMVKGSFLSIVPPPTTTPGVNLDWSRTDTMNLHGRYKISYAIGDSLIFTTRRFNQFKFNYKVAPGYGTITVQLGMNGAVIKTIDCNRALDNEWSTVDLGKQCEHPYDTVIVYHTDIDTVKIYGWALEHTYNYTDYGDVSSSRRKNNIEIHEIFDGGATAAHFYGGKNRNEIKETLTQLDISLLIFTILDGDGEAAANPYDPQPRAIDAIAKLLLLYQSLKSDMDIMLICPNNERTSTGQIQRYQWDSLAQANNWAYLDFNNIAGSFQDLDEREDGGAGLISDSIHFNTFGSMLTYQALSKILLPAERGFTDDLRANSLTIYNDRIEFPNSLSIRINSENPYPYLDIRSNRDVVIGYQSGMSLQPAANARNTFIGYQSGMNVTTGINNTFIGASSGSVTTTGSQQTIIGLGAGANNNESATTAIGYFAGNTGTGSNNTYVGYLAGRYKLGTQSVFMGQNAGGGTGTSNQSVYVGANAGEDGLNGSTSIGNSAGRYLAGRYNTAYGFSSLQGSDGSSNGWYNTAVGYQAGLSVTTGYRSVFLGTEAGESVTSVDSVLYIANGNDFGSKASTWIFGDKNYNIEIPNGGLTVTGDFELNGAFNIPALGFTAIESGDDKTVKIDSAGLTVGNREQGYETVLGGGDSYPVDTVFQFDMANLTGTTITSATDRTATWQSETGSSTAMFGGTTVGKAIIIGSDYVWGGLKAKIVTAGSMDGGDITMEYIMNSTPTFYDALYMATDAGFPLTQYGWMLANISGKSEQWRFGYKQDTPPFTWTKTTMTINGNAISKYWVIIRITTAITTDPIIEQFKMHTDRFEINAWGGTEFFDSARPIGVIDVVKYDNTDKTPTNIDIQIASGITATAMGNGFANSKDDGFILKGVIPEKFDTGLPICLKVDLMQTGTGTGDVELEMDVVLISNGFIFDGTATIDYSDAEITTMDGTQYKRRVVTFYFNVESLVPGDEFVISVHRDAQVGNGDDTLAEEVAVTNWVATGVYWR